MATDRASVCHMELELFLIELDINQRKAPAILRELVTQEAPGQMNEYLVFARILRDGRKKAEDCVNVRLAIRQGHSSQS